MHRFFIPKEWRGEDKVSIKGEQARQICHVLRLKPQDHITVLDNTGVEYEVEVEILSGELVQGKVIRKGFCPNEPKIKITLFQALLKIDKFEFVLQKGVELGVSTFVPFLSERCVVKKPAENRVDRWRKIVQEAAEQSKRALVPALHPVVSFEEACQLAGNPSLLLWEGEKIIGLSKFLKNTPQNSPTINIFVGPEGGFPTSEVKYARSRGIVPVSLGCRILRAETAGLVAISAILYDRGELG
jgi:16S rRNA (uracil1498-N3)-methyltransferase